jgi:hypothetical protein
VNKTGSSKWAVALVIGAVLFVGIPRVVDLFQADSARQVLGALLSLAFFAWLTWRLAVQLRDGWEQERRFWYVSAAGYATFFVIEVVLVAWDVVRDDFRPAVLVSLAFMALFVVSSLLGAKQAATFEPRRES